MTTSPRHPTINLNMASWQVTAKTIPCDYVGDYAVIMIYPDGSAQCAYVNKYNKVKDGHKKLKNCKWPDCPLVADFQKFAFTI